MPCNANGTEEQGDNKISELNSEQCVRQSRQTPSVKIQLQWVSLLSHSILKQLSDFSLKTLSQTQCTTEGDMY